MRSIIFAILCLPASITFAGEIELVSMEILPNESAAELKPAHPSVNCTFELIFSLESGVNMLAMRLSNNTDNPVNISKMLLGLDESYQVKFDGHILPNAFNNHQLMGEVEREREKAGLRWLIVPPKSSVLVSLDPRDWQLLEDLSGAHQTFKIELQSELFHSPKILLHYKK